MLPTILIAEDNSNDEELLRRALESARINNPIVVTHDGEEALDYIFRRGKFADRPPGLPQVVLMDIKMPRKNGIETLEEIRSSPATRNLPVVMLTTSSREDDKMKSYDLGANSYVRKPVKFVKFVEAIQSLGLYWTIYNQPPPFKEPGL